MDLKHGHLYWPATRLRPPLAGPLASSVTTDVLVVGSGITGALVAQMLSMQGVGTVVVDRRALASGSTPASTALVLSEIDTPLLDLQRLIGAERASRAYRASFQAMHDLAKLVGRLDIDCDWAARPAVYLASSDADSEYLEREAEARRDAGLPAEFLTRDEIAARLRVDRPGAILSSGFEVNPVALTHALLASAAGRGVELAEFCEVDLSGACSGGPPFTMRTRDGRTIRAGWVVIATGYEAPEQFAEVAARTRLRCTYAMATRAGGAELLPGGALVWEHATPYLYARSSTDGRMIVGGEDDEFSTADERDRRLPDKIAKLRRAVERLRPTGSLEPEYSWAGTFAETADGLPLIGAHPRWPHVLFALGYGGNGITFGLLAAQLIRDQILGRRGACEKLFSVDRDVPDRSS